jgi:sugar phosphate permease
MAERLCASKPADLPQFKIGFRPAGFVGCFGEGAALSNLCSGFLVQVFGYTVGFITLAAAHMLLLVPDSVNKHVSHV